MAYNEEEYPGFGGQGIFCDLGAIYRQNRWQAGVAVRNIGSMSWRGVKGQRLSEPLAGEIITGGPEGPVFAFEEEEFEYQAEEFSSYTHSLPLVIEVHGSYQVLRSLAVSGGLEKAMANGWGYSSSPGFGPEGLATLPSPAPEWHHRPATGGLGIQYPAPAPALGPLA